MLSIQDTTPTSLVHRTQLRDFLFQARNKPMPRPSYHVLVQRLTNQTEVVSGSPAAVTVKACSLMLGSAQHGILDGEAADL
jgi:hypothetical protein